MSLNAEKIIICPKKTKRISRRPNKSILPASPMRSFIFLCPLCVLTALFQCLSLQDDQQQQEFAVRDRLRRHVDRDHNRCNKASWATNYTALHRAIIQSSSHQRLVAVPFISGMADRIVGLATTFLIAILTDRAFQMGTRAEVPPFEFAFDSPHIDWARQVDPSWLLEPLAEHATTRAYNESFTQQYGYCAINNINDESLYNNFLRDDCPYLTSGQCSTVMSVSNRGRTIQMFENPAYAKRLKEMELNPYTAFGCMVNFLLQPKPEIFLPVYNQFEIMSRLDPTVLKISIQIRAGDHVFAAESNGLDNSMDAQYVLQHYDTFFSCAEQIEQFVLHDNPGKYSSVLWYLASESRAIRRAAVALYGDKVVTSLDSTLEHSSKENIVCSDMNGGAGIEYQQCKTVSAQGFAVAAAEWWMLGYADYHVITMSSGYGRSGAYRTLSRETIYTIDKHKSHAECSSDTFTPLEDLMYNWSGI